MNLAAALSAALALALPALVWAGGPQTPPSPPPPQAPEDLKYQAAIAAFTAKMKAANYPALFDQAAQEFNVPADVLKGIAFAETRWDQLTWPPGQLASPETGMPRPYGIMSLWDNPFFGHSLLEAAALVGKSPEELKQDPLQNIRGAAALLRKLYDENSKPEGTTEADIESWRYAIRKYCGIPEPELNAQHALDIYTWMNQGYHQYGIEWNAHPVNLEPIREETRRIIAEAQAQREAKRTAGSNSMVAATTAKLGPSTLSEAQIQARRITNAAQLLPGVAQVPANPSPAAPSAANAWWYIGLAVVLLVAIFAFSRTPANPPE